jgi:AraC-like DNA-binding protein
MQELPLLRTRYAQKFAATLNRLGETGSQSLRRSNLDEGILELGDGYMPVFQFCNYVEHAAQESGIWHLGLAAGGTQRKQHSDFSREVALAPTLYQSLQTVCANGKTEDTTAAFQIVNDHSHAWLHCGRVDASEGAVRQFELYRYAALLEIIRYAAGPDWLPPKLTLQSVDDGRLKDTPLIRDVNVQFGSNQLAIAMPLELMSRSLNSGSARPRQQRNESTRPLSPAGPLPFEHAVKEVVKTQMLARRFKVADVAKAIGMPTRSLQRRLADRGLSHSVLLEQARIESARALLEEEEVRLLDVAAELGYRHSTHFSRAFKRVCGVTPGFYRKMQRH